MGERLEPALHFVLECLSMGIAPQPHATAQGAVDACLIAYWFASGADHLRRLNRTWPQRCSDLRTRRSAEARLGASRFRSCPIPLKRHAGFGCGAYRRA